MVMVECYNGIMIYPIYIILRIIYNRFAKFDLNDIFSGLDIIL